MDLIEVFKKNKHIRVGIYYLIAISIIFPMMTALILSFTILHLKLSEESNDILISILDIINLPFGWTAYTEIYAIGIFIPYLIVRFIPLIIFGYLNGIVYNKLHEIIKYEKTYFIITSVLLYYLFLMIVTGIGGILGVLP